MKKSGFVAVVGRPNSGKSTFINSVCGKKIAIVSHVPQTTRNTIKGIYTKDNAQIVFLDTPGIHESVKFYNAMLSKQAKDALGEADAVLYMIDLARPFGKEEEAIFELIKNINKPTIIAFNKIDMSDERVVKNSLMYKEYTKDFKGIKEHYISALKLKNLDDVLEDIIEILPEGEFFYPVDMHTDQAIDFMASEVIREKIMLLVHEELPHAVKVNVRSIDEDDERRLTSIFADILVERDSQKAIIIGKGAAKLKRIGMDARKELEEMFGRKVFLSLTVKVDKNWRNHS